MRKQMTIIVILAAVMVVISVLSILSINAVNKIKSTQTTSSEISTESADYFSDKLEEKAINELGIPVEGFIPDMFLQVFPMLEKSDFNNVEAILGIYRFENNELRFMDTTKSGEPVHSAQYAITENGMKILLENISDRLGIEIKNISDVDLLLARIS